MDYRDDCTVRIGGTNMKKVKAGVRFIKEVRADYVDLSDDEDCEFGYSIQDVADGFKEWNFYCDESVDNPAEDLLSKLIPLTAGGDFEVWYYYYTYDGTYESCLKKFENGECTLNRSTEAGYLEINGAIAAVKLEEHFDVKAALLLIDVLDTCCFEGYYEKTVEDEESGMEVNDRWFEGDLEHLYNAHLAATALANAYQRWPELLSESLIQGCLVQLNRNLGRVLEGVEECNPFDYDEDDEEPLTEFKAIVEAAVLEQCTPRKPRRKAGAVVAHRI
jgi:hypothetical protein